MPLRSAFARKAWELSDLNRLIPSQFATKTARHAYRRSRTEFCRHDDVGVILGAHEYLVQSLGNAVRRKCIRKFLAVFREREKSDAACVRRADEPSVVAETELFDETFAFVGLRWIIQHSATILFDIRSAHVAHGVCYDSCMYAVRPFSESSTGPLEVGDVPGPQIQNLLGVDQRRSKHRRVLVLERNDVDFIFVLAVPSLTFVVIISVWRWIDLNIWICGAIEVRLIAGAACFVRSITVIAGHNFGERFATVGWLIAAEHVLLQNFWDGRFVVIAVDLLDVMHTRPFGAFIVAIVPRERDPALWMNLQV